MTAFYFLLLKVWIISQSSLCPVCISGFKYLLPLWHLHSVFVFHFTQDPSFVEFFLTVSYKVSFSDWRAFLKLFAEKTKLS